MSTAEDVFYLYERNSRYYYDCNLRNCIQHCSDCLNNECYCHLKQEVKPFTIGDQDVPCNFERRCYIKPGEECPICFDKIMTKSTAFISNCGHSFHKKCIFKCIESKWSSTSYTSHARCPLCRTTLGYPEFNKRYRSTYFTYNNKNDKGLDKLEDFWLSKDYTLPSFCSNRYDHYLGTNNDCNICKSYIDKGDLIYEL